MTVTEADRETAKGILASSCIEDGCTGDGPCHCRDDIAEAMAHQRDAALAICGEAIEREMAYAPDTAQRLMHRLRVAVASL